MLKKDLITLCLLHLLSQGDEYGYEILSRLHEAFPDTQDGYSESYQGRQSEGPPRKYYRLTPSGNRRREFLLSEWRNMCRAIEALGIE